MNIADQIKVEVRPNINDYGSRIYGRMMVEAGIPLDSYYQTPPQEYMEELVKAKIIAYFYGKVLKDLEYFRGKYSPKMDYETTRAISEIIDNIYQGKMVDNEELI